ncbi:MAG: hypothetical protein RLP44_27040 [Aggregatilineales bacterium]
MAQNSLVAIVNIKHKQMFELYGILKQVQNPYRPDNPYIRFGNTAHFVRLMIVPGKNEDTVIYAGEDQDRGQEDRHHRLAFWGVFDGTVEAFINDIVTLSPDMDAIWSKCEGYNGNLLQFLTDDKHRVKENIFYSTFPDDTVATLNEKRDLRQKIEAILDKSPDNAAALKEIKKLNKISFNKTYPMRKNLTFAAIGALLLGVLILCFVFPLTILVVGGAIGFLYLLLAQPYKESNAPFAGQTGALEDELASIETKALVAMDVNRVETMRLYSRENVIAQNQFNLYLTFKTDNRWLRVLRMRVIMFYIGLAGKYLLPPGSLGGLSTVHFGVWALIDDNRRLLFMTCYDGTWENYIADFVNHIHPILDIELHNFVGFSPYGTRDIASFRRWLRRVQIQSSVFYSGYPDLTVRNMSRDDRMNDGFPSGMFSGNAESWLERF